MSETAHVPDVSVLIPVYNAGAYLRNSITSITAQTLTDIEIVAVDDGSTDGSSEVLDRIAAADPRVRVLHQPNGGIVAALNAGLALTRGRYVARMDGDDLAWPERLARQRDYLDANPDVVAAGTLYRAIDADGMVVHVQRAGRPSRSTDIVNFPPMVTSVPHPTLMVRGEVLRALNGYRSFFPHAEDQDLFIRLAAFGRVVVMPEVLLDYRVHAGATSARNRATQINSVLKAQCAAMIEARTGTEVFAHGDVPTVEAMLAGYEGLPSPAAWEALRATYELDNSLDRRAIGPAWRVLRDLLCLLICERARLRRDGVWGVLMRRAVKAGVRLAHMRAVA